MREKIDDFYLGSIAMNSPGTEDLTSDFKELTPEQKSPELLSSETDLQNFFSPDDIKSDTSPKKNKRSLSEISGPVFSDLSSMIQEHAHLKQQNESISLQLSQLYTQAKIDFKKEREKHSLQVEQKSPVSSSLLFTRPPGL